MQCWRFALQARLSKSRLIQRHQSLIGKANTAAQFLLVALVLASLSFKWSVDIIVTLLCYLTAATALLSAAIYAIGWHRSQAGGKA